MPATFHIYQKDTSVGITPSLILLGAGDRVLTGETLMPLDREHATHAGPGYDHKSHEVWVNDIRVCAVKGKPIEIIETLMSPAYTDFEYRCAEHHDLYIVMDIPKEKQKKDAPVVGVLKSALAPLMGTMDTTSYSDLAETVYKLAKEAHGLLESEKEKKWSVFIALAPSDKVVKLHKARYIVRHEDCRLPFGVLALYISQWMGMSHDEIFRVAQKMGRA